MRRLTIITFALIACQPKMGEIVDPPTDSAADDGGDGGDGGDGSGGDGGDGSGGDGGDGSGGDGGDGSGGDGSGGDDTGFDPSDYEYEEDPPAPLLTAADVEAALAESLPRVGALDPTLPYDVYDDAHENKDGACPALSPIDGIYAWVAECTASSGWSFSGEHQWRHVVEDYFRDDYFHEEGLMVTAAQVTSPTGELMHYEGEADLMDWSGDDGSRYGYAYFQGEFRWDGETGRGTWLNDDVSLTIRLEPSTDPAGGRSMAIDGGISRLRGAYTDALLFREMILHGEETGAGCALEPSGVVIVHDEKVQSYEVTFDGPAAVGDPVDASACDGCGEVTFRGESLGTACADFSVLMQWSEWPW